MNQVDENPEFEALLNYLKQNCGCDLTGNKCGSLMRRFQYRMQQLGIKNYGDYLEYLQSHAEECAPLLDTILINCSDFFRDSDYWDYLANNIIPQIITSKQPDERIRVWSAGCSSGQEVYTLVMLLVEALGIEQYLQRVQVFATDIDKDALKQSRQASYSQQQVADIPNRLLSKYFEQTEQSYIFDSKLRRTIVFGCHDLAKDAPMSKIDLLVCRNVLIYLTLATQATVLVRFHFALTDKGFLFLGKVEGLTNDSRIFTPISLKYRIFAKGQKLSLKDHLRIKPQTLTPSEISPLITQTHIAQAAFFASPFAQLAVDSNSRLLMANDRAYALFNLKSVDLGARLQDLAIGQLINLTACIQQLEQSCHLLRLKNIAWVRESVTIYLDIHITPILDSEGKLLNVILYAEELD
ncbi:MAG: protein-glutamate O-methyltransferase CheR [Rivularia sp. (in: Bacteria)]|nr:protein-glutamate O-methyltransferase CheR [Rivularia sp. MS3]